MPPRAHAASKSARLHVSVTDGRGRPIASNGLAAWLTRVAPRAARGDVSLALITDAAMRRLNREFRRVDHATDVLTFPAATDDLGYRPRGRHRGVDTRGRLGDIAIALGVAGRQARRLGHARHLEVRILALHGLLHLLGYDHETDQGQMHTLEERLRRRARLPTGLIARAGRRASRA